MHVVTLKSQQEESSPRISMELLGLLEMGQTSVSLGSAVFSVTALPPEFVLEAAKHRHTVCPARGGRWDTSCMLSSSVAPVTLMQILLLFTVLTLLLWAYSSLSSSAWRQYNCCMFVSSLSLSCMSCKQFHVASI